MKPTAINLICFSPTRTTYGILEAIAGGFEEVPLVYHDLTLPADKRQKIRFEPEDLVIFGAPVYAGRLAPEALKRFEGFQGKGTPVIPVVLYGNREFDDALLELKDFTVKRNFNPVAAAAFIGEHSFSTSHRPIAEGRPDETDLKAAHRFGRQVSGILSKRESAGLPFPLNLPGNNPYKELKVLTGFAPVTDEEICSECFECYEVCPVAAISRYNPNDTDKETCLHCCACIKQCPTGARRMDDPNINRIAEKLYTNCSRRKDPDLFFPEIG